MAGKYAQFLDSGDPDQIFVLEEEIASGSFGAVYKGRHVESGKYYAVKIITPEEDEVLDDFMVEISVLKKCNHPNIVGHYGAWLKGEELFIAMELCTGGAVSDIFSVSDEPLREEEIALITRETLKGLQYLHEHMIIHRDIKGANILLTEEGDIKLVDFGVSAELKKPGERRNTLIGTPYWMSPEVIANKTGNVPYDYKADIWSLGICLIELADMNPPLHEIHPMKALMMIPMRDPPTFSKPDRWSKEFRDFVQCCLHKAPEKRKDAAELLNHPFVTHVKDKRILIELIERRRRAEAKALEEEEEGSGEGGSDDENSDSAEAAEDSVSVSKRSSMLEENPSPIGKSPRSSPPHSPAPSHKTNSGPVVSPVPAISPATHQRTDSNSGASPSPRDSARKSVRDEEGKPVAGAPSAGKAKQSLRPNYMTNKKLTQRQIQQHQQQLISRQLMKSQMKEIRKQAEKHGKEKEAQQKQHQKELEQLQQKIQSSKQKRLEQHSKELEKMSKANKEDIENLKKDHLISVKQLQKEQQSATKKEMKAFESDSKKEQKEFQTQLKEESKKNKEEKKKLQASGTVSKKDLKALEQQYQSTVEWKDLMFKQKQERHKQQQEFDKKQNDYEIFVNHDNELLQKRLGVQWERVHQRQATEVEHLHQNHAAAWDALKDEQPLEIKQMNERQELEAQQLQKQQQIEKNQQQVLLTTEQKSEKIQHRKAQQQQQAALQARLRKLAKEFPGLTKKDLKAKAEELTKELQLLQAKATSELDEKQKKQKHDEDEMFARFQASKQEQQKQEFKEQREKVESEHAKAKQVLKQQQEDEEREMIERHRREQVEQLQAHQKDLRDLYSSHFDLQAQLLKEYQGEQDQLLAVHHQEQIQVRNKQKATEQEIARIKADHEEDKKILAMKQEKERAVLKDLQDSTRKQQESELIKKMDELLAQHKAPIVIPKKDGSDSLSKSS